MDSASVLKRRSEMLGGIEFETPPGVVLKRATKADFEGVKELTKATLQGTDFLTSNYMRYMEDPERFIYLALKDGKVVRGLSGS